VSVLARLVRQSVGHLVRIACVLALIALAIMVFGLFYPRPLNVVLSMSLGHVVGFAAAACYLVAIVLDVANRERYAESPDKAPPVE
jgi:hypothetical protein